MSTIGESAIAPSDLDDGAEFTRAFHSTKRVQGFTHQFYRYPARFSPEFVRHVIDQLSEPGDLILDPFMGGGTTIVEALAAGRRAAGLDINGLSHFVVRAKTTPLSQRDADQLTNWADVIQSFIIPSSGLENARQVPQARNVPEEINRFFEAGLSSLSFLRFPRQHRFARCVLLRVGQWALDNRRALPSTDDLCRRATTETQEMLGGLRELEQAARHSGIPKNKITASRFLRQGSITESRSLRAISRVSGTPKLVLTSPPYPGVHILYHRWQVFGRRETPAPYWLADLRDGHGASHYTMGGRSKSGLRLYFETLRMAFENLRPLLSARTFVVQLVAFSDATSQLPAYLDTLAAAGYVESTFSGLQSGVNHVRTIPHRKWYAGGKDADSAREILMIHHPLAS